MGNETSMMSQSKGIRGNMVHYAPHLTYPHVPFPILPSLLSFLFLFSPTMAMAMSKPIYSRYSSFKRGNILLGPSNFHNFRFKLNYMYKMKQHHDSCQWEHGSQPMSYKILGKIIQDPSVSKSNRVHVKFLRAFLQLFHSILSKD